MDGIKLASIFSLILLLIPVVLIIVYGILVYHSPTAFSNQVNRSIFLTLMSSLTAALVNVTLFTPLSYLQARTGNSLLEVLTDIPASIPHPIIGIALLLLDSPFTPTGKVLQSLGVDFFDTYIGLVSALVVVSAPIYIRSASSFFRAIDNGPEVYAESLGKGKTSVFLRVVLPQSYRSLASSALISMSRAMSEFGSIAIVAYYILQNPFYGVEPASVLVYEQYGYYGPQVAVTISAELILVSIPVMLMGRILNSRRE